MSGILAWAGVPRLWHHDSDELWRALRRYVTPVVAQLAPAYAYGAERIPPRGGLVIAANHFSAIDHPLLAALCPRPICFVAKAELLAMPLFGEALTWTGAFPVRRGMPDRAALRHASALAEGGEIVGVHLEGTRQRDGRPGPYKAGAVMIALAAGVPVLPCGLATAGWSPLRRRPSVVVFGKPLTLAGSLHGRHGRVEALRLVGDDVTRLWQIAVTAQAAGCPATLPDGARRGGFVRPAPRRASEAPARAAAVRPAPAGRGRRAARRARGRPTS